MAVEWLDLQGLPYLENGRVGDEGIDCYGLVLELKRRDGHPIPDIYNPEGGQEACSRIFLAHLHHWRKVEQKPGAVILIRLGRRYSHCAYVLDDYWMLHTWEHSGGVVKERIENWRQRIVGFYEYVGAADHADPNQQPV